MFYKESILKDILRRGFLAFRLGRFRAWLGRRLVFRGGLLLEKLDQ